MPTPFDQRHPDDRDLDRDHQRDSEGSERGPFDDQRQYRTSGWTGGQSGWGSGHRDDEDDRGYRHGQQRYGHPGNERIGPGHGPASEEERTGQVGGQRGQTYGQTYGQQGMRGEGQRGKGPIGYQRSDERVKEEVCDCLTDDDSVDASGIEVTVAQGEVTLKGTVRDRAQKRRAEDILYRVRGVKDVHNQLRITAEMLA